MQSLSIELTGRTELGTPIKRSTPYTTPIAAGAIKFFIQTDDATNTRSDYERRARLLIWKIERTTLGKMDQGRFAMKPLP